MALDMLIKPYLYELSDNGRVNIFIDHGARLDAGSVPTLDATLADVERRHEQGIVQIGPIARERVEAADQPLQAKVLAELAARFVGTAAHRTLNRCTAHFISAVVDSGVAFHQQCFR